MHAMPEKFQTFVRDFTEVVDTHHGNEPAILEKGAAVLKTLISQDDWLQEAYAKPHPQYYQQYLLYLDPQERFSVVSFVWGPGQKTPIHNHTVWALIGMMRGAEVGELFECAPAGQSMRSMGLEKLHPGDVDCVSPSIGDIHRVSNAFDDQVSISVHVYGGNIGRISRHVFVQETSERKPFISGYSNEAELTPA
ncbi:cysteine dioxygenase [Lampropedia aestuarii]|uniref:Cysteine dioxygenase n=1 Tax=Lampropedia aestuarii TaxID=2562762 RepID=A0A4S5BU80_9BURK|nr:cysteine dioxygenase [Lampropedia aestuarii]MDH5856887.1 cysteine dioxygenase [Lampropedia aestuarii]THJ36467.1 cysteine dioxygenase [Lampropedia aestuarii]